VQREWYEIQVEGHLPSGWSEWFEGLDVRCGPNGVSVLSGSLPDQAALHGVLDKIRDLNLRLVLVSRRSREQSTGQSRGNSEL
jgi:hypothetical protein